MRYDRPCPARCPADPRRRRTGPHAGATSISELIQLIYSSRPFGYDEATLSGILLDARQANARDGITGALICRRDIYLQFLEGPAPEVRAAYDRIRRDDRHIDLRLHQSETTSQRLFGAWAMLHDPAQSLMWSPEDLSDTARERLHPADLRRIFEGLASTTQTSG
ncbi:BLUF domain-containing protein [Roseicyclus marinus]|uniref:BLUF domain-containing protein n=1 Tax=Roseicyclus marinus TaxID=2161673 RepID=UPI002410735C|nr:BLUF domain-containing protein [Roseicyclus marinus]MDG3042183.1 BLUF domain-containing protein [Roseicyclus marinus]